MSNQQFRDVTYHNWWLTGKQALKYNVIDELVVVGCDKSLLETTFFNFGITALGAGVMRSLFFTITHRTNSITFFFD